MQISFSGLKNRGDILTLDYSVPSLILHGPHVSHPLILTLRHEIAGSGIV